MPKPGDSWALFKKLVFLYIEEHPGVQSFELVQVFNAEHDMIMESIDVLLYEHRIYWVENRRAEKPRHTWGYYAYPRPTAWEVLLQDDVV